MQVCQHLIKGHRDKDPETPLKSGQILPNRDILIGNVIG